MWRRKIFLKLGLNSLSAIKDVEERHKFCPRLKNSWCLYQSNKITGEKTYKVKLDLPIAIKNAVTPIFKDLSDEVLLRKCLHGQTQNNNESLNGVIWKKCPKDVFVGREILETGVNSAVIQFNEGAQGVLDVLEKSGVGIGKFALQRLEKRDVTHKIEADKKSSEKGKSRRKYLRQVKKKFIDIETETEKPTYGAGAFD